MELRKFTLFSILLLWLPAVQAETVYPAEIKIITGLDISTGKYGESASTDILYLPLTVKYSTFPWRYKLTLPYLSIRGPGTLVGGIDGVEVTNSNNTQVTTNSGPGDVQLSASWALDSFWNNVPYIDLVGKIKLPTADESAGLGTGKTDYQVQIDIAYVLDNFTPLATLGYKVPGDTETTDYRNQLLASVGFDFKFDETKNGGLLFDFRQASTDLADHKNELLGYINWNINKKYSVNTYLVAGFGDASPDIGGGIQLSFKQ